MNFLQGELHGQGSIYALAGLQRAYGCSCNNAVFFLNSHCLKCDTPLGYESDLSQVVSLTPGPDYGLWRIVGPHVPRERDRLYRRCQNLETPAACNWLIPADEGAHVYCVACRLNRTIPNLSTPEDAMLWGRIEAAKRRVISALVALGPPLDSRIDEDIRGGLAFDFLRSPADGPRVITGHESGLITLNIEEADDVKREQARTSMHEPYRTLVGHFRHEIGHYYWDRLVAGTPWVERYRNLFGDERIDYGEALRIYYQNGPTRGWSLHHVSAYASSHPWEDWAETWAHYMHMVDSLGTATGFELYPEAIALPCDCFGADVLYSPDGVQDSAEDLGFLAFVNSWVKLAAVMNELCRSMGQPDFYPFALANTVVRKLHFVHLVVCSSSSKNASPESSSPCHSHYA